MKSSHNENSKLPDSSDMNLLDHHVCELCQSAKDALQSSWDELPQELIIDRANNETRGENASVRPSW